MKRKAVVVGCDGQDGRIASDYLVKKGYSVLGIGRKDSIDITNFKQVAQLVRKERPDEIYHLAAFHHSSQDRQLDNVSLLAKSFQVNVLSLLNFLEAARLFSPRSKIFFAASSLVFGNAERATQNEETKFNPDTMYGITKASGV